LRSVAFFKRENASNAHLGMKADAFKELKEAARFAANGPAAAAAPPQQPPMRQHEVFLDFPICEEAFLNRECA
jgi:hypothetical protein